MHVIVTVNFAGGMKELILLYTVYSSLESGLAWSGLVWTLVSPWVLGSMHSGLGWSGLRPTPVDRLVSVARSAPRCQAKAQARPRRQGQAEPGPTLGPRCTPGPRQRPGPTPSQAKPSQAKSRGQAEPSQGEAQAASKPSRTDANHRTPQARPNYYTLYYTIGESSVCIRPTVKIQYSS